jgi:hypothetical protein
MPFLPFLIKFSSHTGFERGAHEDHLYIAQSRPGRRPIGEAHTQHSNPAACVARQPLGRPAKYFSAKISLQKLVDTVQGWTMFAARHGHFAHGKRDTASKASVY